MLAGKILLEGTIVFAPPQPVAPPPARPPRPGEPPTVLEYRPPGQAGRYWGTLGHLPNADADLVQIAVWGYKSLVMRYTDAAQIYVRLEEGTWQRPPEATPEREYLEKPEPRRAAANTLHIRINVRPPPSHQPALYGLYLKIDPPISKNEVQPYDVNANAVWAICQTDLGDADLYLFEWDENGQKVPRGRSTNAGTAQDQVGVPNPVGSIAGNQSSWTLEVQGFQAGQYTLQGSFPISVI